MINKARAKWKVELDDCIDDVVVCWRHQLSIRGKQFGTVFILFARWKIFLLKSQMFNLSIVLLLSVEISTANFTVCLTFCRVNYVCARVFWCSCSWFSGKCDRISPGAPPSPLCPRHLHELEVLIAFELSGLLPFLLLTVLDRPERMLGATISPKRSVVANYPNHLVCSSVLSATDTYETHVSTLLVPRRKDGQDGCAGWMCVGVFWVCGCVFVCLMILLLFLNHNYSNVSNRLVSRRTCRIFYQLSRNFS